MDRQTIARFTQKCTTPPASEIVHICVFKEEVYPVYYGEDMSVSDYGTRIIEMTRHDYEQFKAAERVYFDWQKKLGEMYSNGRYME